jgi:cytochrome c oxidase subunit II
MSAFGLPPQASAMAQQVDALFYTVTAVTVSVGLAVFVTLVVFGIRYRSGSHAPRAEDVPAAQARARKRLEIAWTLTPLLLFIAAFGWAGRLYVERTRPPAGAMSVFIVARQWMWKAQHAGGEREIDELHVPLGQPMRLVMTSQDVIHSFFVPAFRAKQDVLPGRDTEMWFTPTLAGRFHLFCAEYCGTDHSGMVGEIVAMEPPDYAKWLSNQAPSTPLAQEGGNLFRELGCSGCHGIGSKIRAPVLEGLYGKPVPLSDGTIVTADDRYIRDSILLPRSQVAAGYEPLMPSFEGKVSEEQLLRLVLYIKSLAGRQP